MTSDNTFTLDPDYENFNPKITTLKFETVAGMHFSRIVVYFTVATCIALILLIGFIVTEYHDQLFLKNGVETSFTFANCTEQRKMINTRGQSATIYTATL